jgi:DNA repair exonuclease SbcCD ATPase subunit
MAVEGFTGEREQAPGTTSGHEPSLSAAPTGAQEDLRAEVQQLRAENERYREHATRTSKLFLAVTDYAEWVRENARHDAELALRKARARVEQLETIGRELEEKQREHARLQSELEGLQAVIAETRARLSAFLTAGLEALNSDDAANAGMSGEPKFHDLRDALHSQLGSAPAPAAEPSATAQNQSDPR